MAFRLPPGLREGQVWEARSDDEVAAIESGQPPGTRMLVALVFPFRWPGFGWSADQADWAARNIQGLQPWPEPTKDSLRRVIVADDTEPVWWVGYLSSPAWWVWVIGAIVALILAPILLRIVRTILPEEERGGLDVLINLLPIILVMGLMGSMTTLMPSLFEKIGIGPPAKKE